MTDAAERPCVLIIEDETLISMMYEEMLVSEGFAVRKAYDVDEALAALKRETFAAVVLDLKLGETSGSEVLAQWPAGLTTPVIVASGNVNSKQEISLAEHKTLPGHRYVVRCLTKPVGMRELADAIDDALKKYPVAP